MGFLILKNIILIQLILILFGKDSSSTSILEKALGNITVKASSCPAGYTGDDCELECGLTYYAQNQRILGGSTAVANSWPSTAFILFTYGGNFYLPEYGFSVFQSKSNICGGTLIDRSTVLTAAHCIYSSITFTYGFRTYTFPVKPNSFYPDENSMFTIYLGLQDSSLIFKNNINISPAVKMTVSNIIVHDDYDPSNLLNDIALIKLSQPVILNQYIQVACLPNSQPYVYPSPNQPSWAIGWGSTYLGGPTSNLLRNVKLTVYDSSMCRLVYQGTSKNWNLQICAGEFSGGKDTCNGDAGGPLFVLDVVNRKSKYVLAGVTSYGFDCGKPGYPGIYTKVSAYIDWIESNRITESFSSSTSTFTNSFSSSSTSFSIFSQSSTSSSTTSSYVNSFGKNCPIGFVGDNCEIECGLTYFTQNQKIVGGVTAIANSWPAQIYIKSCYAGNFYLKNLGISVYQNQCFVCGGTLIDRSTVLTAGHCIYDKIEFNYRGNSYSFPAWSNSYYPTNGSLYTVYLGMQDVSLIGASNIFPGVKATVSRVVRHENYDEGTTLYDIAILKLTNPVTLNQYIQPACLPTAQSISYPSFGQPAWSVGWGTTSSGGLPSDKLQNVKLTVYNPTIYCSSYSGSTMNWNTQICAGEYSGGKDTCQGDSGGPLYVLDYINGKQKYVVSGIVSYGYGCADPQVPGIYTRVSAFLDWIAKNK